LKVLLNAVLVQHCIVLALNDCSVLSVWHCFYT